MRYLIAFLTVAILALPQTALAARWHHVAPEMVANAWADKHGKWDHFWPDCRHEHPDWNFWSCYVEFVYYPDDESVKVIYCEVIVTESGHAYGCKLH